MYKIKTTRISRWAHSTLYLSDKTGEWLDEVDSAVDWACSRLVLRSVFEGVAHEIGRAGLTREVEEALERVDKRRRRFSLPGDWRLWAAEEDSLWSKSSSEYEWASLSTSWKTNMVNQRHLCFLLSPSAEKNVYGGGRRRVGRNRQRACRYLCSPCCYVCCWSPFWSCGFLPFVRYFLTRQTY